MSTSYDMQSSIQGSALSRLCDTPSPVSLLRQSGKSQDTRPDQQNGDPATSLALMGALLSETVLLGSPKCEDAI